MILFLITAGAVFALCQFFRDRALKAAMPAELPGVRLQRTVNKAGAGGVMKHRPALVTAGAVLALGMTLVMAIWGSREKQLDKGALWGLGLVTGGGASNLFERLCHGGVLDYIRFPRLPGRLGKLVFANEPARRALEEILHPLVQGPNHRARQWQGNIPDPQPVHPDARMRLPIGLHPLGNAIEQIRILQLRIILIWNQHILPSPFY